MTAASGSTMAQEHVHWLYIPVCRDANVVDTTAKLLGEVPDAIASGKSVPRHLFTLLPAHDPALLAYAANMFRNTDCNVEQGVERVVHSLASDFQSDFLRYLAKLSAPEQQDILALSRGDYAKEKVSLGQMSEVMEKHVVLSPESHRWSLTSPALANAIKSQFDVDGNFEESGHDSIACALARGRRREFIRKLSSQVLLSCWDGEDSEEKQELRAEVETILREHFVAEGVAPISSDATEFMKHPLIGALVRHRSNSGVTKWLTNPINAGRDKLLSAGQAYSKFLELLRNRIVKLEDADPSMRAVDKRREEEELDQLLPPNFAELVRLLTENDKLLRSWSRLELL